MLETTACRGSAALQASGAGSLRPWAAPCLGSLAWGRAFGCRSPNLHPWHSARHGGAATRGFAGWSKTRGHLNAALAVAFVFRLSEVHQNFEVELDSCFHPAQAPCPGDGGGLASSCLVPGRRLWPSALIPPGAGHPGERAHGERGRGGNWVTAILPLRDCLSPGIGWWCRAVAVGRAARCQPGPILVRKGEEGGSPRAFRCPPPPSCTK